jgi:hypothetical protein
MNDQGVSKRLFLGGLGGGVAVAAAASAQAAASNRAALAVPVAPAMAGTLDLAEVPVIDTHMHPIGRASITAKYGEQADDFAKAVLPVGGQPRHPEAKAKLEAEYQDLVMGVSRRIGYFNYVSRAYGVPPTLAGFDQVLTAHSGSNAAFSAYTRSILDRENVAAVLLQSRSTDPVRPASLIPEDRFEWTYRFTDMIEVDWARKQGFATVADTLRAIDAILAKATANGCRGFKNDSAYYRPLSLSAVSAHDAQAAMDRVLAAKPIGADHYGVPLFADDATNQAVRTYQDYIFKHVYVRAGELKRPIIIHSAVALHPALRPDLNDPAHLYPILTDPAIVAAETHFVVIHTGFPNHNVLASMNSQFTRLYVDVSHISKYPGALEQTLRSLIGLGPTYKIMHGSDTGTVPEEIGYCAWNTRHALGKILSEYKASYGWTQDDISRAAREILHENARRLFAFR